MPHNLYLHSALVQSRKLQKDEPSILSAIRFNYIDSNRGPDPWPSSSTRRFWCSRRWYFSNCAVGNGTVAGIGTMMGPQAVKGSACRARAAQILRVFDL